MIEETFKKLVNIEMNQEDADLWRWVCRNKELLKRIKASKRSEVVLNIDIHGSFGTCKFSNFF